MAALSFRGQPYVVDIVLRPVLSGARWVVGVVLGALLWWLDFVYWVPVPVVVATALMEGWLLLRSDRPIHIDIDGERLVVDDRFAATLTIFHDRVRAVTVVHQPRPDAGKGGHELVIVIAAERHVLLAVAVQTPTLPPLPSSAVDVARIDAWLGARAGLLRALAPVTRICRQRVHDASLMDGILAWAPAEARGRRALRVWSGDHADLSPFGLHTEEPLGLLLLDDDGWRLVDGDDTSRSGPVQCVGTEVVDREAVLIGVEGEEAPSAGVLPLLLLQLASHDETPLSVAIPAPGHGGEAHAPVPADALHTHAPEGAVLLAWLEGADALPDGLRVPARADREPSLGQGDTQRSGHGDAPE